jgi:hypothetical protein
LKPACESWQVRPIAQSLSLVQSCASPRGHDAWHVAAGASALRSAQQTWPPAQLAALEQERAMSPPHLPVGVQVAVVGSLGGPPALLVLPPPPGPPPTVMQHSCVAPSHETAPHAIGFVVVGAGRVPKPELGPPVGEPGTLPVVAPGPTPALPVGDVPGPPEVAVTDPSSRIFPPQAATSARVPREIASIEDRVICQ